MNVKFFRCHTLNIVLLIVTAIVITIAFGQLAIAKTRQEVANIASPIAVQINSSLGDASGVIIAKNGNNYTVLTVNHAVKSSDIKYTVRTSKGKDYQATNVTRLQTTETDPDLAVVKFESSEQYPVATLADSDTAVIGSQIFVYGYPATGGLFGAQREPELSPGLVTSRPRKRDEGYTLRYQAVTWSGMSGGPVFDSEGRVIGLHGQPEFGSQTISGEVVQLKTWFNAAVPINTFIEKLGMAGINKSGLKVDNSRPTAVPISIVNPKDAQGLYFRGLVYLDEGSYFEAIGDFHKALTLNPNNTPELHFNIGNAMTFAAPTYTDTRCKANIIGAYTKAIEANPRFADAYYNRAIAYLNRQDKPTAIADFQKAAELYKQGHRTSAYQDAINRINQLQ